MRVLITRSLDDAEPIADALRDIGVESVIEPLLTIEPAPDARVDLDRVQAILLTSRNGVRALARITARRDVPLFAVGDATAGLARESGFTDVESASGDSIALAELVAARLDPAGGALLHGSGAAVAGDLAGTLSARGFTVHCEVLYEARPVDSPSEGFRDLLAGGSLDAAMFFSPRTAQTFVNLVRDAGLEPSCRNLTAVCISPAVARSIGRLDIADVRVADRPDAGAMVAVMSELSARREPEAAEPEAAEFDEPEETTTMALEEDELTRDDSAPRAPAAPPDTPPGDSAAISPTRSRGGLRVGMWLVLVVLVLVGAGLLTWPKWKDRLPVITAGGTAAPGDRLPDLEQRLRGLADDVEAVRAAAIRESSGVRVALTKRLDTMEQSVARLDAPSPQIARLNDRIVDLGKSVAELRAIPPGDPAPRFDPAPLSRRITGLEQRIVELSARFAQVSGAAETTSALQAENHRLTTALIALAKRLNTVESAVKESAGARAAGSSGGALIVAVGQLRDALSGGRMFVAELDALRAVARQNRAVLDAIAPLAQFADRAVPTVDRLIGRFSTVAGAAARAALAPEDGHWVDRTVARLASVITIRRVGEDVAGDTPSAILARAEARIGAGDLAGGDVELSALTGAPAEAVAEWRRDAAARLAADRAVAELTRLVITRLAAPAGAGSN